jgi:hypothetical protein
MLNGPLGPKNGADLVAAAAAAVGGQKEFTFVRRWLYWICCAM